MLLYPPFVVVPWLLVRIGSSIVVAVQQLNEGDCRDPSVCRHSLDLTVVFASFGLGTIEKQALAM